MTDFTKLLNRGHQRYIAKYRKKRNFGRCSNCEEHVLLLEYVDPVDTNVKWLVCEDCFVVLQNEE